MKKYLFLMFITFFISNTSWANQSVLSCPSVDQIVIHGEKDLRAPGGWIGKFEGHYDPSKLDSLKNKPDYLLYLRNGTCDYISQSQTVYIMFNTSFNPNHRLRSYATGDLNNCWDNPHSAQQNCYWAE